MVRWTSPMGPEILEGAHGACCSACGPKSPGPSPHGPTPRVTRHPSQSLGASFEIDATEVMQHATR